MSGGEAVRRSVADVASESAGTPPTVGGRCTLLVYQPAPGMPDPPGPRDDCPARHGGRHCRGEHRSAAANEKDRESHRGGEPREPGERLCMFLVQLDGGFRRDVFDPLRFPSLS